MQEHDMSWVRTEMALAQAAPRSEAGSAAWIRKNLFATPVDSAITVLALLFVAWVLPQILGWTIFNAQWTGEDRTACLTVDQGGYLPSGWSGACKLSRRANTKAPIRSASVIGRRPASSSCRRR